MTNLKYVKKMLRKSPYEENFTTKFDKQRVTRPSNYYLLFIINLCLNKLSALLSFISVLKIITISKYMYLILDKCST